VASDALTSIEAEGILIQVHLQVLRAHVVIDAANTVLSRAPEALYGVRVTVARDIDTLRMMNALMAVSHASERIVNSGFIREDDGLRHDTFTQMRRYLSRVGGFGMTLATTRPPRSTIPKTAVLPTPPVP
jgi:hypothetical protein